MCMGEPGTRRFATREAFDAFSDPNLEKLFMSTSSCSGNSCLASTRLAASTPADMQVSADRSLAADKDAA